MNRYIPWGFYVVLLALSLTGFFAILALVAFGILMVTRSHHQGTDIAENEPDM